MNNDINNTFLLRKKHPVFFLFLLLSVFSVPAQKGNSKMTVVQRSDEPAQWVMVDADGFEIYQIYAIGEYPDNLHEGLRRIVRDDKIGFINKKGKLVISPQYSQATPFFKGKSIVNINAVKIDKSATDAQNITLWEGGSWGVINKKGNVVKPVEYIRSWNDSIGNYQYEKSNEIFILTRKGKIKQIKSSK
jgi:hypothetical protein